MYEFVPRERQLDVVNIHVWLRDIICICLLMHEQLNIRQ